MILKNLLKIMMIIKNKIINMKNKKINIKSLNKLIRNKVINKIKIIMTNRINIREKIQTRMVQINHKIFKIITKNIKRQNIKKNKNNNITINFKKKIKWLKGKKSNQIFIKIFNKTLYKIILWQTNPILIKYYIKIKTCLFKMFHRLMKFLKRPKRKNQKKRSWWILTQPLLEHDFILK